VGSYYVNDLLVQALGYGVEAMA